MAGVEVARGGTLEVGPYSFWFFDLTNPKHVWWAHRAVAARMRST